MDDVDKLVKKIKKIKSDLERERTYDYITEKYGITIPEIQDIKCLDLNELNHLRESIEYIRDEKEKRQTNRKISTNLGYGPRLVGYVLKELGYEITAGRTAVPAENYVNELEDIWRRSKAGESAKSISVSYSSYSDEDIKTIVDNFEKRVSWRRTQYSHKSFDFEKEKARLQRILKISDDIIDYILKGTPISNQRRDKKEEVGEGR